MAISVLTEPAVQPVTLDQVKQHLRVTHDEEDALLDDIVSSAVAHIEAATGHHLIERSVRQYVDAVPESGSIALEGWPVQRIETVTGYKADGTPVVLGSSLYSLQPNRDPAQLELAALVNDWMYPNGLDVDYVTGHGVAGPDVPSNITRAILVICEHWYEHRGAQSASEGGAVFPAGLDALLRPARRVRV